MEKIFLSPSKIAAYENDPYAFYLRYILRVKTEETGAYFGFGRAIDMAVDAYLRATITGTQRNVDTVAIFERVWDEFRNRHVVKYNTTDNEESLRAIGMSLCKDIPQAWADTGMVLALDTKGQPIAQRDLEIDIGNGVVLRTKLDIAAYNRYGQFGILDCKSTKTPSSTEFTLLADQLTAYQIAVLAHRDVLGIEDVEFLGFWEFLKRSIPKKQGTKGPYINAPEVVDPRTDAAMKAYLQKAHWVADNIRAGRYPRTPRMAFNTPCDLCEYAGLCTRGNTEGLVFPSAEVKAMALDAAAA